MQLRVTYLLMATVVVRGDVCTTPACRKASGDVLNHIDPGVDPCRDFYAFACGGLFKKTYDAKPASLGQLVAREVDDQTTRMLQARVSDETTPAYHALRRFFRACTDEVAIERAGLDVLTKTLEKFGGWPLLEGARWNRKKFSVEDLLLRLRHEGYDYMQLFYFGTAVGEGDNTLLVAEPIVKNIEPDFVDAYSEFLKKTCALLGIDVEAEADEINDILKFKLSLLHALEKAGPFKRTTVASIQSEFPTINWANFIRKLVYPNPEPSADQVLYFPSTEYLKELSLVLKHTSNRTVANYLIWKAVEGAVPFLPHAFVDLKAAYPQFFFDASGVEKTRLSYCKKQTRTIFPPVYEMLYISEYFPRRRRENVKELVSTIHVELIGLLNETGLYDDHTRNVMLGKAKAITYHFGAPERLFDEGLASRLFQTDEDADTDDFLALAAILTRQRNHFRLNLEGGVNRYDNYYEETTLPYNFYETYRNAFVIPAASLQGLRFNEARPQYLNFGTVGAAAAIELLHGFTETGAKYDKHGKPAETWTKSTADVYEKRADCLVREASFFEIQDTELRMDGRSVLEKTACDYAGVEIAYRAYATWTKIRGKEADLPGMNYNARQLFWIAAASSFCDTVSLDHLRRFVVDERQVHPTFRVFGSFSNNVHFGKDFNCSADSPMNPTIKCQVF